jgi:hypothetical protein
MVELVQHTRQFVEELACQVADAADPGGASLAGFRVRVRSPYCALFGEYPVSGQAADRSGRDVAGT